MIKRRRRGPAGLWEPDAPLHCHEVWSYDDERCVQKLDALKCLCPRCHEATHPGHANIKGRGAQALEWLMPVNGWLEPIADDYQAAAFAQWEERSQRDRVCDLSRLREYGVPCRRCSTIAAVSGA